MNAAVRSDAIRLVDCFHSLPAQPGLDEEALRKAGAELTHDLAGLRITGTKTISDDEVIVGVQTSASGEVLPFPLKRVGNKWKLNSFR